MQILKLDPRALKDNPDDTRRSKSSPQSDALLLATVKAVGIIQPPVISPEVDGGNGYIIQAGHRRVKQAIAAGLEEITVLVVEAANDNGAMRSMVENIAREPLNPVDQWRGIERLVAIGWTEEAIGVALALPVRQIRKLRLLANVLPAMLDHMALGDMPNEQQLRTVAAASLDEQKEVWKAHKPKKNERADWYNISRALSKTRMFAKDASFGDDLATAYGIEWVEDLFAPADQDSRYTTNVEAFLGAQQEWMTNNLPKKGAIIEVNNWGQPELPKKAERVYGKPSKSDHVGMYLDRDGKVQSVAYRMPEDKNKSKGGSSTTGGAEDTDNGAIVDAPKSRPDVTQKGQDMIGDFRTDALHEALGRAPIEDETLMALLVLAFAGLNVRVIPAPTIPCSDRSASSAMPPASSQKTANSPLTERRCEWPRVRCSSTCCRAAGACRTVALFPGSPVMPSARTTSCPTWVRKTSCCACLVRRWRRRLRKRTSCRVRRYAIRVRLSSIISCRKGSCMRLHSLCLIARTLPISSRMARSSIKMPPLMTTPTSIPR